MNKIFLGLTLFILFVLGSVYGILFTKPGNNIVASYIENTVNEQQKDVKLKVNDFTLTFNTINFDAVISDNSVINISGDLQLLAKKVDLKYDINIKDLSKLQALIKQKLNGSFSTSGTLKGDASKAVVDGIASIAKGEAKYYVNLENFEPSNIDFTMNNAKIDELLYTVDQAKFVKGDLNIVAKIKNAKIGQLDGTITSSIKNGKVINEIANKQFNQKINVPITFKSNTDAVLSKKLITSKTDFISSLATLNVVKSVVELPSGKITSDYSIKVQDLAKLESIIGTKLNGSVSTSGDVVINKGIIKADGTTDIFDSLSKYSIKLANGKAEYIKANISDAKIEKLLYFVNQAKMATGKINIDANIKSADVSNLDGLITTTITNGKVINSVVNKEFKQKLKKTITFKGDINTTLAKTQAISKANILSSLANIDVNKAVFDIKTATLNSDYLVKVSDLSKLYDVTQTKMRGKMDLNGDIKSSVNSLLVTGNSKLLGGALDFILKDDNFNANVNGVQVKQLTHMMYYPEVFDSTSKLKLDYNLLSKKGKLTGNLIQGHFLENDFSSLINQFAKFNLTREIYDTVDINSDINNLVLKTIVKMKSKNTQIDVTKSILDLEKTFVDANVKAQIRKLNLDFDIKGNTKSPKIKLNTKDLFKNKINDKINKKLGDKLKDKLGDEGAKDLLNNFKSLF